MEKDDFKFTYPRMSKSLLNVTPPKPCRLCHINIESVGSRIRKDLTVQIHKEFLHSSIESLKKLSNTPDNQLFSPRLFSLDKFSIVTHIVRNNAELQSTQQFIFEIQNIFEKFYDLPIDLQYTMANKFNDAACKNDEQNFSPLSEEELLYINSVKTSNPQLLSVNMLSAISSELTLLLSLHLNEETRNILLPLSIFVTFLLFLAYRKNLNK